MKTLLISLAIVFSGMLMHAQTINEYANETSYRYYGGYLSWSDGEGYIEEKPSGADMLNRIKINDRVWYIDGQRFYFAVNGEMKITSGTKSIMFYAKDSGRMNEKELLNYAESKYWAVGALMQMNDDLFVTVSYKNPDNSGNKIIKQCSYIIKGLGYKINEFK